MGQEAPPQTAGERFGRKLALISYTAAVGFRDGGSADGLSDGKSGLFDVCMMRAATRVKILEKRMQKVNGKPYLRTRIALPVVVFQPPNDVCEENSYPYAGKSGNRVVRREKAIYAFFPQMSFFLMK